MDSDLIISHQPALNTKADSLPSNPAKPHPQYLNPSRSSSPL